VAFLLGEYMYKKRILLCNDASFLSTGFANYGMEVLKRLYSTDKYELAELASYGGNEYTKETRQYDLPWTYYPNLPINKEEEKLYQENSIDQFGNWKFERVALDFKPDIVWDIRDWWMLEHQERSPFRPYYHWVIMPTIDAAPQDEQWISTYMNADGVFTYSDWGFSVLQAQTRDKLKLMGTAPPGFNPNAYKVPADKKAHRKAAGIDENIFIIGTVMRNQSRKLYPDLIEAFSDFIKTTNPDLAKRSYLYLHCAYPDLAWDIPKLLNEFGVASKTIMTYFCKNCGYVFPSFYQDVVGVCRRCRQPRAVTPRSMHGIRSETLGEIMGLFDVYVQYSIAEGFGIPQIEAAACGVPVFAVDYSAMSDVVRKINGFPINVQRFYKEAPSGCYRALPDNLDFIKKLEAYLSLDEKKRKEKEKQTRQAVEFHYNWDKTAKIWDNYFDTVSLLPNEQRWSSPPNIHNPNLLVPQGLSNEEFAKWAIANVAGRPDLVNSYMSLRLIRDLNWEMYQDGMGGFYLNDSSSLGKQKNKPFDREEAIKVLSDICNYRNFWEIQRVNAGGRNV
jgi:glycosyltransferase involved in cell wall biosynthesis